MYCYAEEMISKGSYTNEKYFASLVLDNHIHTCKNALFHQKTMVIQAVLPIYYDIKVPKTISQMSKFLGVCNTAFFFKLQPQKCLSDTGMISRWSFHSDLWRCK